MTSTDPDEAASTRPWGASLAMAGAMAAGLAAGRSATLALAAGITAAVGLKSILRRRAVERIRAAGPRAILRASAPCESPKTEAGDCCSGEEKSPELDASAAVRAADGVAQRAGHSTPDETLPLIWEQGRDETVSCGAVGAQTVWFGMHEPTEVIPAECSQDPFRLGAVPAVPALAEMTEPPGLLFCEAPDGTFVSLPAVPAIAEDPEAGLTTDSAGLPPLGGPGGLPPSGPRGLSGGSTGIPGHGVWNPAKKETIREEPHRGPHRSVVPHAPVDDGQRGRWVVRVATVVLVIVALAVALGVSQRDGWISGLKLPWQVARGAAQEQHLKDAGVWAAPPPHGK